MDYETEIKPRDLMKEIGRLSGNENDDDDCSISTIEKGCATDLCRLHHETSPIARKR